MSDFDLEKYRDELRQRMSGLSNAELAEFLMEEVYPCVGATENEYCGYKDDHDRYRKMEGAISEACHRLKELP